MATRKSTRSTKQPIGPYAQQEPKVHWNYFKIYKDYSEIVGDEDEYADVLKDFKNDARRVRDQYGTNFVKVIEENGPQIWEDVDLEGPVFIIKTQSSEQQVTQWVHGQHMLLSSGTREEFVRASVSLRTFFNVSEFKSLFTTCMVCLEHILMSDLLCTGKD
jgi:hypothetical protein